MDSSHTGMSLRLAHRVGITALTAFLLLFHPLPTLAADTTIRYVDKDNTSGAETGLTWDTAFTTIQPTIDAAYDAGGGEVWIAEGTYDEQRTSIVHPEYPETNTGSVVMQQGVHLYGGFIGIGADGYETSRDQGDWESHETIIDGSTARNGEPAYHVVIGADNATLDGFTVTGGNANVEEKSDPRRQGGGLYNDGASLVIANCIFTDNSAKWYGGGVYNRDSSVSVTDCTFTDNSANHNGGGMYSRDSTTSVMNCTFTDNSARGGGGGIYNTNVSASITNCVFVNNSANDGGGMYSLDSTTTVMNCTFTANSARDGGGKSDRASTTTVMNCTFTANSASYGGAARAHESTVIVTNCTFWANVVDRKGGGILTVRSSAIVTNCTFASNSATEGGGMWLNSFNSAEGASTVTNSILWNDAPDEICFFDGNANSALTVTFSNVQNGYAGLGNIDTGPLFVSLETGDFRLQPGSPCIDSGTEQNAPAADILGMPRPQFAGVDMGSYEFTELTEDTDGDTIVDAYEGDEDSDEDGTPNYLDPDSDGDGIPDLMEGIGDLDVDLVPAFLDLDSDGDGIADETETAADADGDGRPNYVDLDSDGDGWSDNYEGSGDPDGDGIPSYLDLDRDGDGVPDSDEPVVILVDRDNAFGAEDGFTWDTAFTTIQPAIDAARNGGGGEVWVAEGTYGEERTSVVHPEQPETNTGSVVMQQGVHLYGGFTGVETSRDQRDWTTHETIIDGSTARDGKSAYHVVFGADNAVLDGFTVTGGNANGSGQTIHGGGMYNARTSPSVTNCTFSGNSANSQGGGMYGVGSSTPVTDCSFRGNSAGLGGGVMFKLAPILRNCTFVENSADKGGAGAFRRRSVGRSVPDSHDLCKPTLIECTFSRNLAAEGGALHMYDCFRPTLTECTFLENAASGEGGAVCMKRCVFHKISSCFFFYNQAEQGGGMHGSAIGEAWVTEETMKNSVFAFNKAARGGGLSLYSAPRSNSIWNCTFYGNSAEEHGGMYVKSSSPRLTNCIFWNDSPNEIGITSCPDFRVKYSDVKGGFEGEGNIDLDPLFANAAESDFRLTQFSPCIDAGILSDAASTDIVGTARPQFNGTDMGVYEYDDHTDTDGDGIPNAVEGDEDPDGDGIPSYLDLDSDGDGILDVVERVVHVDKENASGIETGQTWDTAFTTIQSAIDAAYEAGGREVWVAEGTYDEERTATRSYGEVIMREAVHLYGGFIGIGKDGYETSRDQRDWETHETIIDGSTARNGKAARHVVVGADNATLDGFTVTGGKGENGGGMYNAECSPSVVNCTFTGNSADEYGGGMYTRHSTTSVTNCTFANNSAQLQGGGMYSRWGSSPVTNCTFRNNSAPKGGAVYSFSSSLQVRACIFESNLANAGGAISQYVETLLVTDSIFVRNTARKGSGGAIEHRGSERGAAGRVNISGCTFLYNSARLHGGSVFIVRRPSAELTDCLFTGNSADYGGGIAFDSPLSIAVTNCLFTLNSADRGGGVWLWGARSFAMTNSILWENTPDEIHVGYENTNSALPVTFSNVENGYPGAGNIDADPLFVSPQTGDFRLQPGSPCIDAGTEENAPAADMLGTLRPQFAGIDMGPYEFPEPAEDADGDWIPDVYEGDDDLDSDGLPNYLDVDSDGDGILDIVEAPVDFDLDRIPNFLDLDSDGDGIADETETADDADGDGTPNYVDLDSDGDGTYDSYEGSGDPDGDGIPNYLDLDRNGNGVPDADEPVVFLADRDNVSGVEDGFTWDTAFTTIQPAIEAAYHAGSRCEVWIAEGTYAEERNSVILGVTGTYANTGSVVMREGVDVYGGFTGTEISRDQRNWQTHATVIDGSTALNGERAYHVVIGADGATLDGFTVTGGYSRTGAGMYNENVSPTVRNCTFTNNTAYGYVFHSYSYYYPYSEAKLRQGRGGGMFNYRSSPEVANCTFAANIANGEGAGMHNEGSSPRVINCTFADNSTTAVYDYDNHDRPYPYAEGRGGAMYNFESSPEIVNCTFTANSVEGVGGGVHNRDSSPILVNCVFEQNQATALYRDESVWREGRGGAIFNRESSTEVVNCTLTENFAEHEGGGVYNMESTPAITNTIVWVNSPDEIFNESSSPVVTYCDVQGGYDGEGNIDADPLFLDSAAGDFRLSFGSPCIDAGTAEGAPTFDIEGNPRPQGWAVDIGAYEHERVAGDANLNGIADAVDIQLVVMSALGIPVPGYCDMDGNGAVDAVDIQFTILAALGLFLAY